MADNYAVLTNKRTNRQMNSAIAYVKATLVGGGIVLVLFVFIY